jgi:hypothetical protein
MKIKEFDTAINQVLEDEVRRTILEQADLSDPLNDPNYEDPGTPATEPAGHSTDSLMEKIKNFQSLSGLLNKITTNEEGPGNILITVTGVSPEELVESCGGSSLGESLKNLMQGIHHDLEENQYGKDLDVDIDTQGDENALTLIIRISSNKDKTLTDTEMNEDKNESTMKKTISLSESDMAALLKRIIKEAAGSTMDATTQRAIKDSGTENTAALKAVEKKIKDYLNFKGNDKPENFNQIGQGEEKVARQNSEEEDEVVNDNRGRGMQDLTYDQEPSKMFKDRLKMSLIGDSKMGNPSDAANAIKTDVGNNIHKTVEKRQKIKSEEPRYKKEGVPVKEKSEGEPERGLKDPVVEKDIERMKQLGSYNNKTQ